MPSFQTWFIQEYSNLPANAPLFRWPAGTWSPLLMHSMTIYRALSVLAGECNFIQSEVYKNSFSFGKRSDRILCYNCTNYYFEIEQEDEDKKYGKSKEHRPNPIIQMGLFTDGDGIPLAFFLFSGNSNEQTSLKPLEKKILQEFGHDKFICCNDAGLRSEANREFLKTLKGMNFADVEDQRFMPLYKRETIQKRSKGKE